MDVFWLVVGSGGYILAGGGWRWVVVDGGEWWHSLFLPKFKCLNNKKSF